MTEQSISLIGLFAGLKNYLPKMSIPVERRDLGDDWVLTCRGEDGSDLTLSDVKIKRENLICQILGGDTLFFPMFGDDETEVLSPAASAGPSSTPTNTADGHVEESILDHIRSLLLQAQTYGCWKSGVGGVGQVSAKTCRRHCLAPMTYRCCVRLKPPSDRYVAAVLQGLPVSSVLNCAIELWRNLEIDDDELLEIAIRDVSFQIQLQQEREERSGSDLDGAATSGPCRELKPPSMGSLEAKLKGSGSFEGVRRRFNPRVDPTVLFLEMTNLTLSLDNFLFRIEKSVRRTVFDPVFEGRGMVLLQNVSIRIRVECAKERIKRTGGGAGVTARKYPDDYRSFVGAASHSRSLS